jgi:multiple sugar transport system substrate-binding protein
LPLDEYLPHSFLADQDHNSVGKSHTSYSYNGHPWALAIDAAAPVSSWRHDLLERRRVAVPENWDDLVELARQGMVAVPAIPIDSLMNFYMLCLASGGDLFPDTNHVVCGDSGIQALSMLKELLDLCPAECFSWNPIAVYEAMSSGDSIAYCPFAYGYSNYSRPGYGRHVVHFGDLVLCGKMGKLCSTLGGTGLAISSRCRHKDEAAGYVRFVADRECQRTLYFESGGQPGHRSAWVDAEVNEASNGFFRRTLPALDRAYLRPRHSGYLDFQDKAGRIIQHFLQYGGNPRQVIEQLNFVYRDSKQESSQR